MTCDIKNARYLLVIWYSLKEATCKHGNKKYHNRVVFISILTVHMCAYFKFELKNKEV